MSERRMNLNRPKQSVAQPMTSYPWGDLLRDLASKRLTAFDRHEHTDEGLRSAGVAIVITANEAGQAGVLLTLRTAKLKRHGGQYALPGGRLDDGEDIIACALRELSEELSIDCERAAVLGRLDDFSTRSGFRISPVVVWWDGYAKVIPNPDEVERVFFIPFAELASPEIPQLIARDKDQEPVFAIPLPTVGHEIYAPTAAVLYQFREVVIFGRDTRVAHLDQPQFAWK